MKQWRFLPALMSLLGLALLPHEAGASQLIKKFVLKTNVSIAAGATSVDSTAAFNISGARWVRIVVWSTDVDSTLTATTFALTNVSSGLGISLSDVPTGYVRVITNTAIAGVQCQTAINGVSIRYAPQLTQFGAHLNFFPTSGGATTHPLVFPPMTAKWYTALTGASTSRCTGLNVIAYVYYDQP